jgi:phosphate uptake regulator
MDLRDEECCEEEFNTVIGERAKREGFRRKLLGLVPVYGHYRIEEDLREWDRSVREEALSHLKHCEELLIDALDVAVTNRNREAASAIETGREAIHAMGERIRTQAYGYFPRFSPIKVDKRVLGEALDIDEKVVGRAKALLRDLEDSLTDFESDPDSPPNLRVIEKGLQPIEELVSRRMRLLRTGVSEEEG